MGLADENWKSFRRSSGPSIGIELELQVLDPITLGLTQKGLSVLERLPQAQVDAARFGPEFQLNCVEVRTGICSDVAEAQRDLCASLASLRAVQGVLGVRFCAAGMHPFSRWQDQQITPAPRPRRLFEELQSVGHRLVTFGLHVHVGVASGDEAIATMNGLVFALPYLLALSANSPFCEGEESGLMSMRNRVFAGLPRTGLPRPVDDWAGWVTMVEKLTEGRQIEGFRDLWWDVRPNPVYGTVEVRVCDMPPSLEEVLALAALIQALVVELGRAGLPTVSKATSTVQREICSNNVWSAARWGLLGKMVNPHGSSGLPTDTATAILMLLDQLSRTADQLGSTGYFAKLARMVQEGSGAQRQRRVYAEKLNLPSVVAFLCEELFPNKPSVVGRVAA